MSTRQSLTGICSLIKFARVCFRVRTTSGDHASGAVTYGVSGQGSDFLSAGVDVSGSVQQISVWVKSQNPLDSAESPPLNFPLSDIGETVKTQGCFSL